MSTAEDFWNRLGASHDLALAGAYEEPAHSQLRAFYEELGRKSLEDKLARCSVDRAAIADLIESFSEDRPDAFDITTRATDGPRPCIVEGLWAAGSILTITAEEGFGKTMWADQLLRQLLRDEKPFDFFTAGAVQVGRVLFVDTEMEPEDGQERNAEMIRRGLGVDPDRYFWVYPTGLDLSQSTDARWLERQVVRAGASVVWIDSGANAVPNPADEEQVKPMFNNTSRLMRSTDVAGIAMTLHNRKRAQGSKGRRFDDLYGAREWKGRSSVVLYAEGDRIQAWKDRGGRLRQSWGIAPDKNYPEATLERPGLADDDAVPFRIARREWAAEPSQRDALAESVREVLAEHPGVYAKSALHEKLGVRKQTAMAVVDDMIADGEVKRASNGKLHLIAPSSWRTADDDE